LDGHTAKAVMTVIHRTVSVHGAPADHSESERGQLSGTLCAMTALGCREAEWTKTVHPQYQVTEAHAFPPFQTEDELRSVQLTLCRLACQ